MDRVRALRQLLEAQPSNVFARYGLAQEYAKRGQDSLALEEFTLVLQTDASYQAAYYHAGKALERMGRAGQARRMYKRGITVSLRTGDDHARAELEEALASASD